MHLRDFSSFRRQSRHRRRRQFSFADFSRRRRR